MQMHDGLDTERFESDFWLNAYEDQLLKILPPSATEPATTVTEKKLIESYHPRQCI